MLAMDHISYYVFKEAWRHEGPEVVSDRDSDARIR